MKNIDDENAGKLRNIDISISGSDYDRAIPSFRRRVGYTYRVV